MPRTLTLAAAQLGPIELETPRSAVIKRMIALLDQAKAVGVELVVFPEMALTSFFPRRLIEDEAQVAAFYERALPGPQTQGLFDHAAKLGIAFYLGYCEETLEEGGKAHRYNSAILVNRKGAIVGKYRKVHLPGNPSFDPDLPFQHLEQHYFEPGNLGFPVFEAMNTRIGMLICNDRRWAEAYRVLGLQGVEVTLIGYNTPAQSQTNQEAYGGLRVFHHLLPMQAGAHANGTWVIAAAKAGLEDGCLMMGHSCVISPSGEVVAVTSTLGDELLPYRIDLDATKLAKDYFDFAMYRRPEHYKLIVDRREAGDPIKTKEPT